MNQTKRRAPTAAEIKARREKQRKLRADRFIAAAQMRAQGATLQEIADHFGTSVSTVWFWLKIKAIAEQAKAGRF